ncbi:MAG: hypothetical protein HFI40_16280 [Lachnospiraceae bacterium]|jgi:hypothetical protein|nr:hypothetical protein [Lachnospiraceae bacterium]
MRSKLLYGILGIIGIFFFFGFILFRQSSQRTIDPSSENAKPEAIYDADKISLSYPEMVSQATHILNAEYLGMETTEYGTELMFRPSTLYKGEIEDEIIYVSLFLDEDKRQEANYDPGTCYLLFLEKNKSVYDEHDKYVQLGELYIPETEEAWNVYYEEMQTAIETERSVAPESYGNEFTDSGNIKEVLAIANHIFLIEVESVYVESTKAPTTVYECRVKKTILNPPLQEGSIFITFYNDTVEIGSEYVVLLSDATKTAPIYTLASRQGVYTWEEAEQIAELAELLEEAVPYVTNRIEQSDWSILQEEQKAFNRK